MPHLTEEKCTFLARKLFGYACKLFERAHAQRAGGILAYRSVGVAHILFFPFWRVKGRTVPTPYGSVSEARSLFGAPPKTHIKTSTFIKMATHPGIPLKLKGQGKGYHKGETRNTKEQVKKGSQKRTVQEETKQESSNGKQHIQKSMEANKAYHKGEAKQET